MREHGAKYAVSPLMYAVFLVKHHNEAAPLEFRIKNKDLKIDLIWDL